MDYKKTNAPLTTTVHDIIKMAEPTGNIYETVCIISKRANQIATEMKSDLEQKLQEFATTTLRKSARTVSRLRSRSITRNFPSPR